MKGTGGKVVANFLNFSRFLVNFVDFKYSERKEKKTIQQETRRNI